MTKKRKDDIDDNDDINEGRPDDINEADDNFGLPDVDYTPVDKTEEEPVEHTTSSEETYTEKESAYESGYTAPATAGTTSSYEPERYRRKKESNAPKIIILILVILLVAAGAYYFGIYRPQQKAELARIEQENREAEEARQAQAEADREEAERQRLEAQREAERRAAEEEAAKQPQTGTFEKVSSRTGNYYVIVASSLDEDLATDYAKRLTQQGYNTKLLAPTGNNKFHRVAVSDFGTWADAQQKADELKGEYGDNVWVVKF